jgi:hypothetical protein
MEGELRSIYCGMWEVTLSPTKATNTSANVDMAVTFRLNPGTSLVCSSSIPKNVTTVQLAFWEKLPKNPPLVNLISFLLLSLFFWPREQLRH